LTWPEIGILALVTVQRLGELILANRNTRRLLALGAKEFGRGHYPAMIALHVAWLGSLWLIAPGRAVNALLLALYLIVQLGRVWAVASLGDRWTTRIIVLPGAPLVRRGPYRFVRHPNYIVVSLEIALLPLVFGLWLQALIFTLLNAAMLAVRIRAENNALRG
jgi:methyltransferase